MVIKVSREILGGGWAFWKEISEERQLADTVIIEKLFML